jgi:hypothetical protein
LNYLIFAQWFCVFQISIKFMKSLNFTEIKLRNDEKMSGHRPFKKVVINQNYLILLDRTDSNFQP